MSTILAPVIEFEEKHHAYKVDGVPYVSVTQAIDESGFGNWKRWCEPEALQYASALGQATHRAIELYEEGTLDPDTVDPAIQPRIEAYEKFKRECDAFPVEIEKKLCNTVYGYAGRVDFVGVVRDQRAIVDHKSGVIHPAIALQLAGYCGCFAEPACYARFSLQLRADGTYRLHEYPKRDFREEFSVFVSCVNLANFKRRLNIR